MREMRVDLKETETAFVFKADVPGLKKEEVTLKVEDGKILHVRWQKNEDGDEAADGPTRRWIHRERMLGRYNRKLELPEVFDAEAIRSVMEDGVLTVVMPKQPRTGDVRTIQISD